MIRFNRPAFLDSSYFVNEAGNWHLKDDAPLELYLEFIEFMRATEPKHEKKISQKTITEKECDRPLDKKSQRKRFTLAPKCSL